MTTVTLPYSLTAGQPENVNQLQSNLEALRDAMNGGLDQDNLSSTGRTNLMPWTVDIDPFTTPATSTTFSTLTVNTLQLGNGQLQSSGAVNSAIGWDVTLAAGTWTLNILTATSTDRGIFTATLDGTSVGTMDAYSASPTSNVSKSITGISVSTSGKKRLLLTMATKNASSSSYIGDLSGIRLLRTA